MFQLAGWQVAGETEDDHWHEVHVDGIELRIFFQLGHDQWQVSHLRGQVECRQVLLNQAVRFRHVRAVIEHRKREGGTLRRRRYEVVESFHAGDSAFNIDGDIVHHLLWLRLRV
ncbi:hypothetical protein ES703_83113 [subsurface metagenome]